MSATPLLHDLIDRVCQENFGGLPAGGVEIRPYISMPSSGYVAEFANTRIAVDSETCEWRIQRRDPPELAWRNEEFREVAS